MNNAKLVAAIRDVPPERRTARYHCVMVLANKSGVLASAHGVFEGLIIDEPRGAGGFGYDPYFLIPDLQKTAAELPADEADLVVAALARLVNRVALCVHGLREAHCEYLVGVGRREAAVAGCTADFMGGGTRPQAGGRAESAPARDTPRPGG